MQIATHPAARSLPAAGPCPAISSGMETKKVRYALVGAGNIAQVAILPAFAHAKANSELVAIISHDPQKRSELGREYGVGLVGDYSQLERVLQASRADAVYIATPNSLHRDYALRAATAG